MFRRNLKGQSFGRLVVLRDSGERNRGHIIWTCICVCGKFTNVMSSSLRSGNTRSCGCLKREESSRRLKALRYKHGETGMGLYKTWRCMKQRCYCINNSSQKYYLGRGIIVCPEWRDNYMAFREWAFTNGYKKGLTIDRINNMGNYEPDNCQWLTRADNTRKSNLIRWNKHRNETESVCPQ